jgi:heat shock protein HslJ
MNKRINLTFVCIKAIITTLIWSSLLVISGCNSSKEEIEKALVVQAPSELSSFQQAKTKWDSNAVTFYSIQSSRSCECLPEMSAQMELGISDNLVLSAIDINSNEIISKETRDQLITIDDLFALIEKAIADGISIEVTYNEEFGYPETAKIDLEQIAVDGGLSISLSNLQIKNSLLALDKVTWSLESFDSIAGPQLILDNTNISLSIDMDLMQISGWGGCNSYNADFFLDNKNNNITVSNIISTEIACSEPENIMKQEQSYFATLEQIQFFTFDKATLNMVVGGDAGLHFVVDTSIAVEPQIENQSNDLILLQNAKTKWNAKSGPFYSIQSQRVCECVSEQLEVTVLDNSVVSAIEINSNEVISNEDKNEIITVAGLFTLIEEAIIAEISIEVIYNEEFGYPETAKIDLEKLAVDGGLHIKLSNLEVKNASSALDKVTWILESFDSIAGPQPVLENTNISLSIDMQLMQISGVGGCNNYSADFFLDNKNNDITISNIISTEMACSEPENIMQQEQSYFATLEQVRFFSLNQSTLNMVVGGDAGLHFVIQN